MPARGDAFLSCGKLERPKAERERKPGPLTENAEASQLKHPMRAIAATAWAEDDLLYTGTKNVMVL